MDAQLYLGETMTIRSGLPSLEPKRETLQLDAETKGHRTILTEDGLEVGIIHRQAPDLFWWCVRCTGGHAGSYVEAETEIRKELLR